MKRVWGFMRSDRSTFPYWFAHWCAYQMVALDLKVWRPKFLLHDIEKPWLKLFMNYKRVQKFHRTHSNHHLEYGFRNGWYKMDWFALVIDWECCHYTKIEEPFNARETLENELSGKWKPYREDIRPRVEEVLDSLGL